MIIELFVVFTAALGLGYFAARYFETYGLLNIIVVFTTIIFELDKLSSTFTNTPQTTSHWFQLISFNVLILAIVILGMYLGNRDRKNLDLFKKAQSEQLISEDDIKNLQKIMKEERNQEKKEIVEEVADEFV